MITAICFSRDRAMQLDLLLRSLPDGFDTYVLWKATTAEHDRAYLTCAQEHDGATFYAESADGLPWRCREILEDATLPSSEDLACFLTDDSVFYRQPVMTEALREGVLCHSFRLGRNTGFCYPHGRWQKEPRFFEDNGLSDSADALTWRWADAEDDYGYPGSLDGHVFRAAHLRRALLTVREDANPNQIEEHLNAWVKARLASEFPLMTAETQSSLVGIPVNRVNETHPNRHADVHYAHQEDLLPRYLSGERIALDRMDFSDVRGAHQEIELEF